MKKGFLVEKEAKTAVDEELKRAFAGMQVKLAEGRKGIREAEAERERLEFTRRRAELTLVDLSALPDATPAYATVGRCFVSQSLDEAKAGIQAEIAGAEKAAAAVDKRKEYLHKSIKEQENNLRDMVSQRQAQKS